MLTQSIVARRVIALVLLALFVVALIYRYPDDPALQAAVGRFMASIQENVQGLATAWATVTR